MGRVSLWRWEPPLEVAAAGATLHTSDRWWWAAGHSIQRISMQRTCCCGWGFALDVAVLLLVAGISGVSAAAGGVLQWGVGQLLAPGMSLHVE
jgi:hypothetical protein